MKPHTRKRSWPRAFSLIELLVVIAVIGVIAAIAIPSLSNVNENSRVVAAKHEAQRIASTFGAGKSCGATGFLTASSVGTALDALGTGSNGAGANSTAFFQMAGVSATMDASEVEAARAPHYLTWENDMLIYNPDGGAPGDTNPHPWEFLLSFDSPAAANAMIGELNTNRFLHEHQVRGSDIWERLKE